MQKIAVYTTKGGTGKSSLTVFLAEFLASEFGKRVLVVDLDPQQSSLYSLLGLETAEHYLEEKSTLTHLLQEGFKRELRYAEVQPYVLQRPGLAPPQSRRNAASIGVLATERIEYERIERAIWKAFFTQNRRDYDRWVHLPSRLLTKLDNHYDVCLLDFPAARTGPLTLAGLLASQWWLFPVRPDRMGVRDLDGPYFVMRHLAKSWKHQLRFLSTIPYMCPSTHTNQYADTRKELEAWANDQKIPSLVDRRGWVLYDTKAINALDDTRSFNTLVQRFGSSSHAFYMRIKRLAKEILDTLEIPYAADERDTFAHRLAERFAIA